MANLTQDLRAVADHLLEIDLGFQRTCYDAANNLDYIMAAAVKLSANCQPYRSFDAEKQKYTDELVAVRREHWLALRAAIAKTTK